MAAIRRLGKGSAAFVRFSLNQLNLIGRCVSLVFRRAPVAKLAKKVLAAAEEP